MNNENNTKKVFQCICGKQFDNNKSLHSHKSRCKIYRESIRDRQLKQIQEKENRRLPNGMFKCEVCSKEHDGSYGSGRFCCRECKNHYTGLKSNQTAIKNGNKHIPEKIKKLRAKYGTWVCKYCGQIFETRLLKNKHIKQCHPNNSTQGWSKGLTKYTNDSLMKISKSLNNGYKSGRLKPTFKGRKHTQETKDKIISTYIENRTNNKYRGFYKGIYFQYSFELAWLVWNFEHNIKVFRCEETFQYWDSEQQKERTYYPDFQLEDGTIVEIKGRVTQCVYDKQDAVINKYKRKYLLLTQDKIQHCLDYCKEKYGSDFLFKLRDS